MLWVDVFDAAGQMVGGGPITTVTSATVQRALDGAGSVTISVPLTDERAAALLTNERQFRVWTGETGETPRLLGRGVVRKRRITVVDGTLGLSIDGPDTFDLLKRTSVLLNRQYNSTIGGVAGALAGLAGWSAVVDPVVAALPVYSRFDGVSILKALQKLASEKGVHLRLGLAQNQIEMGAFGTDTGITIVGGQALSERAYTSGVLIAQRVESTADSEAIFNWLLPVGSGEGKAMLTLEHATRSGVYAIQTTIGPDGATLYYLADAASIAAFGQIQAVKAFKEIAPLSNSEADIVNAANGLYDAAAAALERAAVRRDSYKVTVRLADTTIRPGDKVRLNYRGVVDRDGEPYTFIDVNGLFWVLDVFERYDLSAGSVDLNLATVDTRAQDAAAVVMAAIESITLRKISVQPYPNRTVFPRFEEIDSTHDVIVPIMISDATLYLNRALVTIKTRPLRSTVIAAAGGGDHRHKMFDFNAVIGGGMPPAAPAASYNASKDATGTNFDAVWLAGGFPSGTSDIYTNDASGTHTHDMTYGLYDDTQYPTDLDVWINGKKRTNPLGGPWAPSNTETTFTLDITQYLVAATGGLRQEHRFELRCGAGQGIVEVIVELYETVQSISVS